MPASYPLTVYGFHIDVFGHVNNARYLEFLEEARWALFPDILTSLREKNLAFVIVNININYHKPALLGQRLLISAEVTQVGKTSITLSQTVSDATQPTLVFADASVVAVIVDAQGKPVAINDTLLDLFE